MSVVGIRELARWTVTVHTMILAGQVTYDGSAMLAEHVNRAVLSRT
jgi:hypothetical protein